MEPHLRTTLRSDTPLIRVSRSLHLKKRTKVRCSKIELCRFPIFFISPCAVEQSLLLQNAESAQ